MTITTTRIYPFLESGVTQNYEMHTLCGWGIVDQRGHEDHCACPRMIHVVSTVDPGVDVFDYWILEPKSTTRDHLEARMWTGSDVIVGGIIWTEALAQC